MTAHGPQAVRILVVEDEPVNRALLRAVLSREVSASLGSIELIEAPTLASAMAAVGEHAPDVIVLDVRLPDGDGLDLARSLPARGAPGRPGVLVMSASVLPKDRDAAHRSGADAFLGKPFQPAEFVALLAQLIDGRRLADEDPAIRPDQRGDVAT